MRGTTVAESESIVINGGLQECYDAIRDFATYPEWQRAVKKVVIEEEYPDRRPKRVAFTINVILGRVFYVLEYTYDDENFVLSWDFVRGDPKRVDGEFTFVPAEGHTKKSPQTLATYTLDFDTGLPLPKALSNRLTRESAKACLRDLKKHVES